MLPDNFCYIRSKTVFLDQLPKNKNKINIIAIYRVGASGNSPRSPKTVNILNFYQS